MPLDKSDFDVLMYSIRDEYTPAQLRAPKTYPLSLEQIHPVIRMAHCLKNERPNLLNLRPRMIFDHLFFLTLQGEFEFRFPAKNYRLGPHHLCFIPPYVPHEVRTTDTTEHLAVHFDLFRDAPLYVGNHWRQREPYAVSLPHGLAIPTCQVLAPSDAIEQSLRDLVREFAKDSPLARFHATAHLSRILALLLEKSWGKTHPAHLPSAESRNRARLERAVTFLQEHLTEKLSVEDLARVAGLSVSQFARLFREWTGYSPKEYQRRARVEKARRLLADANLSIKEIAAQCGFDDAHHFSTTFRQIDGLPPTVYRETVLATGKKRATK